MPWHPSPLDDVALGAAAATSGPWQTVVWNDPVNLMSYVSHVFRTYFGFSRERAERLMLAVAPRRPRRGGRGRASRWSCMCRPCTTTACGRPSGRAERDHVHDGASVLERAPRSDVLQFRRMPRHAGRPAVARLVPDAYRGDAEAAAEFRRYTEADLLQRRRTDADLVAASLARAASPSTSRCSRTPKALRCGSYASTTTRCRRGSR
jgi:hypothetical protein